LGTRDELDGTCWRGLYPDRHSIDLWGADLVRVVHREQSKTDLGGANVVRNVLEAKRRKSE
jgi:hypothetical protein